VRSVLRKPIVVALLATFLAGHLVCLCVSPSLAATMAVATAAAPRHDGGDPHACCHPNASSQPTHRQAPGCRHCTHAQVVAPADAQKLSAPAVRALPAFVAPSVSAWHVVTTIRHHTVPFVDGHAPPPTPLRTRVLLI
jgi:hypothetical protein